MSETKQVRAFEAQTSQLLKMMIHSVYSNKEIFLRELISNASDAIDKLRFEALSDDSLYQGDTELKVRIDFDAEAKTLRIRDTGIGMSMEEVIANIGTIAQSGTREFLEKLSGDQKADAQLIGQFGVGFYSAFMVSDRVELRTRRAGLSAEEGVLWESTGEGEYSVEQVDKPTRGTEIVMHLNEDELELLDGFKLRQIIRKYSDHISFPIEMPVEVDPEDEDAPEGEYETINQASALWTRPQSEISDEEYQEFYKHVAHDYENPLAWTHSAIEGTLQFSALLYVPARRPFDMNTDLEGVRRGVKLYVRRVFIMDDAEVFMPRYLRFVRGVIDSDDLNLNVSREFLQENRIVRSMRKTATKRVLDMLEKLAADSEHSEKYQTFFKEFGAVLKEGVIEDEKNRERIAKLLRFSSTNEDSAEPLVSLGDYVERMKEGQSKIYYVTAETFQAAKNSPHLEVFRDKGVEVLLLHDRVDEWLVGHLMDFDGHELMSVAMGELDLSLGDDGASEGVEEEKTEEQAEVSAEMKALLERAKETLGERVQAVRVSRRLTSSPACLVAGSQGVSMNLDRILRQAGEFSPGFAPILELNPEHPIVKKLGEEVDDERFSDWAQVLFDQAVLSEGGKPEDPATFVKRMNKLMVDLMS